MQHVHISKGLATGQSPDFREWVSRFLTNQLNQNCGQPSFLRQCYMAQLKPVSIQNQGKLTRFLEPMQKKTAVDKQKKEFSNGE